MAGAFTIAEILAILQSNPERIAQATFDLSEMQLTTRPTPGGWSINETLAHLRGYTDTRGDRRILAMIRQDSPTIRAIHPNSWAEQSRYGELGFQESFVAFVAQREELLDVLRQLPASGWARTATIMGGGGPRIRTIHQTADALARHERSHVRQIARQADTIRSGARDP